MSQFFACLNYCYISFFSLCFGNQTEMDKMIHEAVKSLQSYMNICDCQDIQINELFQMMEKESEDSLHSIENKHDLSFLLLSIQHHCILNHELSSSSSSLTIWLSVSTDHPYRLFKKCTEANRHLYRCLFFALKLLLFRWILCLSSIVSFCCSSLWSYPLQGEVISQTVNLLFWKGICLDLCFDWF